MLMWKDVTYAEINEPDEFTKCYETEFRGDLYEMRLWHPYDCDREYRWHLGKIEIEDGRASIRILHRSVIVDPELREVGLRNLLHYCLEQAEGILLSPMDMLVATVTA